MLVIVKQILSCDFVRECCSWQPFHVYGAWVNWFWNYGDKVLDLILSIFAHIDYPTKQNFGMTMDSLIFW